LSDIEEPLGAAPKEVFIKEIDEVIAAERDSDEISLLQVDRKSFVTFTEVSENTVPSAPGMMTAVFTGLIVPVLVTKGPPKRTSAFDLRGPVFPACKLVKIEQQLGLCRAVVLTVGV